MRSVTSKTASIFFIGISLMLISSGTALAQVGHSPGLLGAPTASRIGVAGAVRGLVTIMNVGQVGRNAQTGESIYLGDEVSTDAKAQLQVLLLDGTTFTIGPNSAIVIDKFVYDPSTHDGEVQARVVKGVFRFVTGKIAGKNPKNMEVKLPVGTIGIRGTMVAGRSQGTQSFVVLLGPGEKNNSGSRIGSFVLENDLGGSRIERVKVLTAGFGTTVDQGKAPTMPFQVPAADIEALNSDLMPKSQAPTTEEGADGEGGATQQSGQDSAAGWSLSGISDVTTGLAKDAARVTIEAEQDANGSAEITDGITTLQQALTVPSGQFHFFKNFSTVDTSSVTVKIDLDFGARTFAGGNSTIQYTAAGLVGASGSASIASVSFDNFFGGSNQKFTDSGSVCNVGCTSTLTLTPKNNGGVVASSADISVTFDDGTDKTSGSSAGLSRFDGLAT